MARREGDRGEIEMNDIMALKLVASRKEAIAWIRAFLCEGKYDTATWDDIITRERIKGYAGDDLRLELAVKWGIEEGAVAMLMTLFEITKEELK